MLNCFFAITEQADIKVLNILVALYWLLLLLCTFRLMDHITSFPESEGDCDGNKRDDNVDILQILSGAQQRFESKVRKCLCWYINFYYFVTVLS